MPIVLAIDDKQDNLISISSLLNNFIPECTVLTAQSGADGIEKAKFEQPDTILLDIHMPGMDGFETCRILKSDEATKHIPVIMLTAVRTDLESRVKGLETGADAFLAKPIDNTELAAQITAMLRIKKSEDILRLKKGELQQAHNELEKKVEERTSELVKTNEQLRHEIEERKQAEAALRESEERFRAIAESSPDAVFLVDSHLNIIFWNDGAKKIFGYGEKEVLGKSIQIMVPEQYKDINKRGMQEVLKTGVIPDRIKTLEINRLRKDGSEFPVEISTSIWKKGSEIFFSSIVRDITERKKAEKEIKETKNFLASVIESSTDGIMITDDRGNLISVNTAIEKISGFTKEELIGKHVSFFEVGDEDSREKIKKTQKELIEKGFTLYEAALKTKDGKTLNIECKVSMVKDDRGNIIARLNIIRDISDRKRMEEQIIQAKKLEATGKLAGGIAHDFNNLLGVIFGNVQLAKDTLSSGDEAFNLLQESEKACMRATDLTRKFITFSSGGSPVKKIVSISELLKNTADLSVFGTNVSCDYNIQDDLLAVDVDRDQISEAVRCIVTNAKEAMPGGGIVKVRAENVTVSEADNETGNAIERGRYVRICISDQGAGISSENRSKIFDPYYSTKERGAQKGMGLGLSTAVSIIKKHGGNIFIESEPRQGTDVLIYIAALSGPEIKGKTEAEKSPKIETATERPKRILFMDDEEQLRNMVKNMLSKTGYEVVLAANGDDAVRLYAEAGESGQPFSAVILDLTIKGGMGGKGTIKKLLQIDPAVNAVVTSGYASDPVMSDIEKYGFKATIQKPFSKEELNGLLKKLIEIN